MAVLVIDTENPNSLKALKVVIGSFMDEMKTSLLSEVTQNTSSTQEKEDEQLTTKQVCEKYGIHRTTLTRWHDEGLPYRKGAPNRYFKSDIMKFMKQQTA